MRSAGTAGTIRSPRLRRRGRHARRHTRRLVLVSACVLAVLGRSISSAVPAPTPGSPWCVDVDVRSAASQDYLTGRACPPTGFAATFGYEPRLVRTSYGWRYTKPAWAGGRCSGPLTDRGPFWDFRAACRTHDYGYDLIRFGVAERPAVDHLLYRDMKASCLSTGLAELGACKVLADAAHAVLTVGDATGFDPALVPHAEPAHREGPLG